MRNIIRFFVKHDVLVNLCILLFLIFGTVAALNLTSSFFPETEPQFINVQAIYPGASPVEMERGVVLKIENNLEGITGIERITSTTEENRTTVTAELYPSSDENEVLQEVKNAVDRISSFPTGLEQVIVYKQEPVNMAGKLAVYGDVPLTALKDNAERIEEDLRDYENISRVSMFGFNQPEIEINVSETDLRKYNLQFSDISRAVGTENLRVTGGMVRGPDMRYSIRVNQRNYYAQELKNIVLKSNPDGTLVRLADVANVEDTFDEGTQRGYLDGERAVFITVNTTNNEDILAASESIKSYVKEYNSRKSGIQLTLVDDATQNLRERIALLQENGLLGAILVLLLLGMFLRIRLAFWVALSIPVSFCGMFVLAWYYGLTINVISLFGMIIVIGILVDDGIVVGENIFQKYEEGMPPLKAAVEGTMQVLPAVTSAIITTVIAFSFFYFIPAQLGEFFSEVSFVVSTTLLVSLVEVTLFLPAHLAHSKSLRGDNSKDGKLEYFSRLLIKFRDKAYIPSLRFALNNKTFVGLGTLGLLIITMGSIAGGIIRTTFFPEIEENQINVELWMKRGINEEITEDRALQIKRAADRLNKKYRNEFNMEQDMFQYNEVQVGYESNQATLNFYLLPAKQREIRSFAIAADLREEVGHIPQADQLTFGGGGPFGRPVAISLISPNFQELREAAEDLKARLSDMPELEDIIDNQEENQPEIHLTLTDEAKALGLSTQGVISQIRQGFFGDEVQRLQRGKNEVRVWVRYNMENRRTVGQLLDMRIHDQQGNTYPLNQLANIDYEMGLVSINHRNGEREIQVSAELADQELSAPEILQDIEQNLMPVIERQYPSIDYSFEGQVRETRQVGQSAQTVLPVLMLLIFAVIMFTFRSFVQSAVLFLIIPFGLIGAGWGHFIHGLGLGILSLLGIIALVGILVNDGLVFVTTLNDYLKEGLPYYEAMVETGRARFRPVLLTTATTAAGLTPLILDQSFQAQFLIPMAVSVAYGLLVGSFLLLVLLPLLLVTANNIKRSWHWLWHGEWPEARDVEPAILEQRWEKQNELS